MKKRFWEICFLCCMFLSVEVTAQHKRANANPHYAPTAPQKLETDMDRAKYLRCFVDSVMPYVHSKGTNTGMPDDFHYQISRWTQHDLNAFAGGAETYGTFEILLGITNTAAEVDASGKMTQNALKAQAALEFIKPSSCRSWKGFYNMIADAAEATQSKRDGYRRRTKK